MSRTSSHLSIEHAAEGLGTESFGFEVPTCAIGDLRTEFSGPEVSTYDVEAVLRTRSPTEAVLRTGSPTEPIFLDSEPTRAGRKRKAKDMSGLSVCLCGEQAKPNNVGSIQCQKAGCATVWVCFTFSEFMGPCLIFLIVSPSLCWVSGCMAKKLGV